MRICALALTIEMHLNGADRIRPALGQLSPAEARQKARADQRRARRQAKKAANAKQNQPQSNNSTAPSAEAKSNQDDDEGEWEQVPTRSTKQEAVDSDSDAGEWITPENIKEHKAKALGLNPAQVTDATAESKDAEETDAPRGCACLTGDYAMQNVLMQMGVTALGPDGLQVKQVRTWVLRCHACFK